MLFMLLVLMGTSAMADLIVTVPPSTVAAWPIGTGFEPGEVRETMNFLGPFSDTPIEIRGWGRQRG